LVQAIELGRSPTRDEIEQELLHGRVRWKRKGRNNNASNVSVALSRQEGRSPSPLISGLTVDNELQARIGGLEENMKLKMEHLNIRNGK
jgi:hypothetical protein